MFIKWMNEIQYLLNTNYCVPDEKYSPKHVNIVCYSCMYVLERRKKTKFTANAALKYIVPFRPSLLFDILLYTILILFP